MNRSRHWQHCLFWHKRLRKKMFKLNFQKQSNHNIGLAFIIIGLFGGFFVFAFIIFHYYTATKCYVFGNEFDFYNKNVAWCRLYGDMKHNFVVHSLIRQLCQDTFYYIYFLMVRSKFWWRRSDECWQHYQWINERLL